MAELIAQGTQSQDRWRRDLPEKVTVCLGRTEGWQAAWDPAISSRHVELCWRGNRLEVKRYPAAVNQVFFQGRPVERVELKPGEHFVIGSTVFTLSTEQVDVTLEAPRPAAQARYSRKQLHRIRYSDADRRLAVLSQLPEMIDQAAHQRELFQCLANVVLTGIPHAEAMGLVRWSDESDANVEVLKWDRRRVTGQPFAPSRGLVQQAIEAGESVLHRWEPSGSEAAGYTQVDEFTWAFACPLVGQENQPWCLYVTGDRTPLVTESIEEGSAEALQADIKFTELVASILGRLIKLRRLERDQSTLRQFFAPVVLDAVAGRDPEDVLAPREAEVTVLFGDLRDFSRQSEAEAADLLGLLERVSAVLGVTTQHIMSQGGVIGDFHGDAVMGFWGWPIASPTDQQWAIHAALAIRNELDTIQRDPQHPLAAFRLGMGLATGRAVAGKIGTQDQVKVTVFGPVVNLAARLESMTRQLKAPILLDEATADWVRENLPTDEARVRRLARLQPVGLDHPVLVHELLPPHGRHSSLTDDDLLAYEQAWESMESGDWGAAFDRLHQVPAHDRVKDFLTVYLAQHDRTPPKDWQGFIRLSRK